jgi:hypothetical protein
MSLTLYGSSVPEPTPEEPAPDNRRRYLIIFATVIALILGGGSAAFLLLNSSPNISLTPNTFSTPGNGATATDVLEDSPSPTVSPSASASPSHSPSPSRSPSAHPSSSSGPVTVVYHAPGGVLCPSVYFQPIVDLSHQPGGAASDSYTTGSNYTDYTCSRQFGKVYTTTHALIFGDAQAAATLYAQKKAGAPAGSDRFGSLGTDAYGYVYQTTQYITVVLEGNLILQINLTGVGGQPTTSTLRDQGSAKMAPATIRNLKS